MKDDTLVYAACTARQLLCIQMSSYICECMYDLQHCLLGLLVQGHLNCPTAIAGKSGQSYQTSDKKDKITPS